MKNSCPLPLRAARSLRVALPLVFTLAISPLLHAAEVGEDKVSAIKGHQKLVIAEFGVEFYTQLHATGHGGSGSKAAMTATLTGVSDDTFHAITRQAYSDTVASLQQAGFEVVDAAALRASPAYQALEQKYGSESPYVLSDEKLTDGEPSISKTFAPDGMKAFFSSSLFRGNFSQRMDAQNQGRGDKEGDIARALGVTLLHVHYLASFGSVAGSKNNAWLAGAAKAKASFTAEPLLFPSDTAFQFVTEAGKRTFSNSPRLRHSGAVFLDKPLIAADNIFSLQDTTTAAVKKSDAIGNAFASLLGGGGQKNRSHAVAPRSEEAFKVTYSALIQDAAGSLSQALAAGR